MHIFASVGLVDIFKSGQEWCHMKDFMYINCCAKGFFSEISILGNKWLLKIATSMRENLFVFLQTINNSIK